MRSLGSWAIAGFMARFFTDLLALRFFEIPYAINFLFIVLKLRDLLTYVNVYKKTIIAKDFKNFKDERNI